MSNSPNASTPDSGGGTLPRIANSIAIVLIAAYLVAVLSAWLVVDANETAWLRRTELLGGLEALAFAAAGAVLGVTVQRPAVKAAQDRASQAENRAENNAKDAEVGNVLLAAVEAKAEGTEERVRNLQDPDRVEQGIKTEFEELARIAESIKSR